MKITLGNREIKSFFKNALPLRKQEICPIRFTPEYAKINYLLPNGKLLILAKYSRNYFKDYESEEEEFVIISKKLFLCNGLKVGFNGEYLTFRADSTKGYLTGDKKDDIVDFTLIHVAEELKKPFFQTQTIEKGLLMPTQKSKEFPLNFHGLFLVNELIRNLPATKLTTDFIALSWDSEDFRAHFLIDESQRKRKLNCESLLVKGEPIIARFNLKNFLDTLRQFEGKIWIGLGRAGLSVSQTVLGSKRTYILFTKDTEEEE